MKPAIGSFPSLILPILLVFAAAIQGKTQPILLTESWGSTANNSYISPAGWEIDPYVILTGTLAGHVTDCLSYAGLAGTAVTITAGTPPVPYTAMTNAAGDYIMTGIPAGTGWPVTATHTGYCNYSTGSVNILANQTTTLDFCMSTGIPVATTNGATSINCLTETLNGTIQTLCLGATASFDFGLTMAYGSNIQAVPVSVPSNSTVNVTGTITGLVPGHTYHYRVNGISSAGTAHGNDMTFIAGQLGTPGPISGPSVVCAGGGCNYIYSIPPIPGATGYCWTIPVGGIICAGNNSPSILVGFAPNSLSGGFVVYGTSSCSNSQYAFLFVNVNSGPVPVITGNNSVCFRSPPETYSTQAGMSNYLWNVSAGGTIVGGGTPSSNTITINWTIPGTQSVSVTYTDLNGCQAASPTVYPVIVNPLPVPTINGSASICTGVPALFTTQPGMTNYIWTFSPGGIKTAGGGLTDNSITVKWNAPGNVWVKVNYTNQRGCRAGTPTQFDATVKSSVVPTITGPASICENNSVSYITESGMINYVWSVSPGGVITSGQGTRSVNVHWTIAGSQTISVIYIVPLGCPVLVPTTKPVTVHPRPHPTITGPVSVCLGALVNYSTEAGMSNYQWILSGSGGIIYSGFGSRQIQVKWTLTGAKTVSVNYSDLNGCSAYDPTILNINVYKCPQQYSLETIEVPSPPDIVIYPDPNSGRFNLQVSNCDDLTFDVSIYNTIGNMVYSRRGLCCNRQLAQEIDMGFIPDGLYVVFFHNNEFHFTRRIVVVN